MTFRPGYLTVDVTIDDNGTEYDALMFAGHMAYSIGDNKASIAPSLSWRSRSSPASA